MSPRTPKTPWQLSVSGDESVSSISNTNSNNNSNRKLTSSNSTKYQNSIKKSFSSEIEKSTTKTEEEEEDLDMSIMGINDIVEKILNIGTEPLENKKNKNNNKNKNDSFGFNDIIKISSTNNVFGGTGVLLEDEEQECKIDIRQVDTRS